MESNSIRDKAQRLFKTVEVTHKLLNELQDGCPHRRIKHTMYPNPYNLSLQCHHTHCDDCQKFLGYGKEGLKTPDVVTPDVVVTKEWVEENGRT